MSRPLLTDFMPQEIAEEFEKEIRADAIDELVECISKSNNVYHRLDGDDIPLYSIKEIAEQLKQK